MPDSHDAPSELRYTREHEWTRADGDVVTVGITAYAQDQLGDVVYVDLPTPGSAFEQGQTVGEVESTKSVSDLYAPVAGTVVVSNEALDERPELVNEDPYGQGWLLTIRPTAPDELADLLDADAYRSVLGLPEEP